MTAPPHEHPMPNGPDTESKTGWRTAQVYALASICLLVGVALGFLYRGSASHAAPVDQKTATTTSANVHSQPPNLDDMKRMAERKAEPLMAELKNDPTNSDLLNQVGAIYKATHQFDEAATYFQKAVDANPKNLAARTDLASCLYYKGDADGAIAQLQQALNYDQNDANSLFNLGMIRLQAKNDRTGAVNEWRKLLKSNPKLPDLKKRAVEKLIAEAQKPKPAE
jgi:cytochrome c-type biogenesis protein CcmH/NrfG